MRHRREFFMCVTLALGVSAGSASAQGLPPGFVEELLVTGLYAPMAMAWAPDSHLWIVGQSGDVWTLHLETPERRDLVRVGRLATSTLGERGVIGIAVDPDFSETGHVWIFYSTAETPVRNRLSRFRAVGEQIVDETVILETPYLENTIHNGGSLRFASDKTLFVSTGDDGLGSATAQNTNDIRGKILHINRDGSPAADNPFIDGTGGDPRVWAYGFRNPWKFNLQPETENLFIGDVGASLYEELDLGVRGGNFGWNQTEGPEPPGIPGIIYPIYYYPHTNADGQAIIAGDHAPALNFPPEYVGNYFFADHVTRELFRMVLDSANSPESVEVFSSGTTQHGPVDIQFGPDGALYYLTFGGGNVFRISFVGGGNRQPVADADVAPRSGPSPLEVLLDASGSFDPEGEPLEHLWTLGDGTESRQPTLRKSYPRGVYTASLTVTDSAGASASVSGIRIVSGNGAPTAVVQEPVQGREYRDGEVISFSGMGIDPEEGLLPCERLSWRIVFHHLGHTHPFLGPLQTCEGSFTIDPHGEEQTFFEVLLSVTDSGGPLGENGALSGTMSVEIFPREP